jgi:hypothetical protein
VGQQRILLSFIEAVDLIDKENRFFCIELKALFGKLNGVADILDTRQDGVDRKELGFGGIGDDAGQSGFTGAGWTIEYYTRKLVDLYRPAQQSARTNNVFLTDILLKSPGAHTVGKGGALAQLLFAMLLKEVHSKGTLDEE